MRPWMIVTTCGISVLVNADPGRRNWLYRLANAHERDLAPDDLQVARHLMDQAQRALAAADVQRARELSAELNVILGLYGPEWRARARADVHYLLHTDTFFGHMAAQILADWMSSRGSTVVPVKVDALTVRNSEELQWGVAELVEWCEKYVEPHRGQYHVIFNLVGGFKAVQGVLNTLGMFYADEIVYVFEGQSEVVRIPRLPVRMDAEAIVRQHLTSFRRMRLELDVDAAEVSGIPETLIMPTPSRITLSGWGLLVWERTRENLYKERLLDSPTGLIRYGPRFCESVAPYTNSRRMVTINERIDDLARYQHTGQQGERLNLKKLQTDVMAPSTHEIDAWHDGDAKRIYLHFEGKVAVLDRLDDALH